MMRKAVIFVAVLGLSVGIALADGNEKSVMGKITEVSCGPSMQPDCGVHVKHQTGCQQPTEVTVQSPNGQLQVVGITKTTQFVKRGAAAPITDLKIGDEVVIHARLTDGGLEASEIRSPVPAVQAAH